MATASRIQLSLDHCGETHVSDITVGSAITGSEVLQENHEKHHIFFNQSGFHSMFVHSEPARQSIPRAESNQLDHIAHHIPTIFALGASPSAIKKHYENNKSYQRPSETLHHDLVRDLHDPAIFLKHLGQEGYHHDYLAFFQDEINCKGHEAVINDYMLKGDERADAILVRMYAGAFASPCLWHLHLLGTRFLRFLTSHHPSGIWRRVQSACNHR